MNNKILDSIVEITKQRDSDALGVSIVATIAELVPSCFISFYKGEDFPSSHIELITSLSAQKDESGVKQFLWDCEVPKYDVNYIDDNYENFNKLVSYQTEDSRFHIFLPFIVDNKIVYAVDVSSRRNLDRYLETLKAIMKVCENFYAILAASEQDTLTGLLNRRTYESKLTSLLFKQQNQQKLTQIEKNDKRDLKHLDHTWLAIIDIDHFKHVNDQYGHIYGDEVLLVLSQLMKQNFRANDLLFRFGGEEFVVIFEPIDKVQVEQALNKFMKQVRNHEFPMVGHITVSCGFAKITQQDHPKNILDNADKALYFAKEHGRDCLHNYEQLVAQGKIVQVNNEGDIELF